MTDHIRSDCDCDSTMVTVQEIYSVTDEKIQQVRKLYQKDENSIKEDIRILNEWWRKQPHLPKNTDNKKLERILLRNKFRVEQTKVKIDNYFTLRGYYPFFFDEIKNNFEGVLEEENKCQVFPLPTLNNAHERIIIFRVTGKDVMFDWNMIFAHIFMMFELESMNDYSVGNRYIMDWANMSLAHYKAMELNLMMKGMAIHQEAYSARIVQIDYVNAPAFVDTFLKLFKIIIKAKLYQKVRIHNTLDDLAKTVDRKFLPSDLGGHLKDYNYYNELLKKALRENKDHIIKNISEISNESQRIGDPFSSNLFGIDGTFKKLNVD